MERYELGWTKFLRSGVWVPLAAAMLLGCGGGGVNNTPPIANAGPDQNVTTGTVVTLDGGGCTDADGDLLTYRWSIASKPAASAATLSDPTAVRPAFTTDADGAYVLSLVVNDGREDSATDNVTITASTGNSPPVANAGPDQSVSTGSVVALNGSDSTDADGDSLTYLWSFTSKPASSTAVLSNATSAQPTFTADRDGTYVVTLVVHDGQADSTGDTVMISATSGFPDTIPPTINATYPIDGATGVSVGTPVAATFSEPVTNVTEATFKLTTNGAPVPGVVTVNGWSAIFTPSSPLATGTVYTATVTTGVKDLAGNALALNRAWTFTTAQGPDTIPPTITATFPSDGARGTGSSISVRFSEPVTNVSNTTFLLTKDGVPVPGKVMAPVSGWETLDWSEATFIPSARLAYGTTYRATVTTGVTDFSGNPLAADYSWSFTTTYTDWWSSLVETGPGDAFSPQIAVGFSSIIVWVQSDGTADSIWANTHNALDQRNWIPTLIETGSGNASSPQVAIDSGGSAIAVWVQSDGTAESIWANRSTVFGTNWGTATLVETGGGKASSPQIATNNVDNSAVVVWVQSDGATDSIWANRFDPAAGWGTAMRIETGNGKAASPQLAMDANGNAVAVWVQSEGAVDSIWANHYEPATGWGTAALVETATGHASSPQVAIDNSGNAVAVWVQPDRTANSIWANRYVPGTGWGTATLIEIGDGQTSSPQVAMRGADNAVAVWVQSDGTAGSIWANRFDPASGWGTATLIETSSQNAFAPQVAMSEVPDWFGGTHQLAIAVWVQSDGVADSIWMSRWTLGGGWGTAMVVETGDGQASSPQVGFKGLVAVAVWEEWDGTRRNIWSSQEPIGFPGPSWPW